MYDGQTNPSRRVPPRPAITVTIAAYLLATAGCQSLPEPDFAPPQPHLKVLTYNVNYGFAQPGEVVDFIARSDADIVCLQETHARWEQALLARLGERYPFVVFRAWDGAGGIAILSKHRLTDVQLLAPAEGWFPALLAKTATDIGDVQILNVHLRPSLSDAGSVGIAAYAAARRTRRREILGFLDAVNLNAPLIVAGDFNEDQSGRAVGHLINHGFRSALDIYDRDSPTWRWLVYGVPITHRFDHILFSDHFACPAAGVTEVPASDHMPVEAVLTGKPQGP